MKQKCAPVRMLVWFGESFLVLLFLTVSYTIFLFLLQVCKSCDYLSVETRCPLDPDAVDALYPGDITKIFNKIMTDPATQQYEPRIVSRPNFLDGDTEENADYRIGPWMVVFENAITDEEAERLIELGGVEGYQRSADVGRKLEDGTYDKKVGAVRAVSFIAFVCIVLSDT